MSDSTDGMIPIYRSTREITAGFGPSVAVIGNFDGVHLGHRENLRAVVEDARRRGARAVAVTFDPHPDQFLRPSQAPLLITPMDERIRLLALTGIDAVVVLPFDAALAGLSGAGVCAQHSGGGCGRGLCARGREFPLWSQRGGWGRGAEAIWRRVRICCSCACTGAGARVGGFQFGNSGAGGGWRCAQGAVDTGSGIWSALDARPGDEESGRGCWCLR